MGVLWKLPRQSERGKYYFILDRNSDLFGFNNLVWDTVIKTSLRPFNLPGGTPRFVSLSLKFILKKNDLDLKFTLGDKIRYEPFISLSVIWL
jgi:hypothetical protein